MQNIKDTWDERYGSKQITAQCLRDNHGKFKER